MSAIANPRPSSRLTRAERFALLAAERAAPAPVYKIGDRVTFDGRATIVEDVKRTASGAYVLTVSNYAGRWMIGETHSGLVAE